MSRHISVGLAISVLTLSTSIADADEFPTKPVRFIVPFAPGGPVDMLARLVGQEMARSFGQQVVIDNRPGANGIIGTDIVAKAAPNGYTVLMGNVGPIAVNVSLYRKLPYDPLKDFAPVSMVARSPLILVSNPALPVTSVNELIRLAKSRPGQLTYGTAGAGSGTHLSMELFKTMAGVTGIEHIPYKGIAPALSDLVAGQIPLVMSNIVPVQPLVKAAKLRGLAVTSRKRSPALPEVPTMIEAGLPGFEAIVWFGVLAPADTPKEVVAKLNNEIGRALSLPKIAEQLSAIGSAVWPMTPEEFAVYIKAEIEKWRKVIRNAKVSLD
ncbi:MAG: tripartite tricarboxylate transporter substrate binding protein [Betaproteobacteria bacterium]|nr:tripartite tricarboxylate transporter substrate binding protein [Betaproteobacteria bacterium]